MKALTICCFLALLAALGGCMTPMSGPGLTPSRQKCEYADCFAYVGVKECVITVVDEYEVIAKGPRLVWIIDDTSLRRGYRFADNGIRLKEGPGDQFVGGHAFAGKTAFVWIDKNTTRGTFPYGVNVEYEDAKGQTQACPEKDPFIINN